ncbi:hypothetical protein FA13DRAFT_1788932 [Coprinellus micaceus]|uniref:DUF6533 domain-containing protein n=1 Tax=Coprinellus micaceus TaxID=71717 RepID=A0A4Y7TJY9_COPMI|nr:hypothetical protein FA13DRAFT_1788932 [Coprinellus micaceus]
MPSWALTSSEIRRVELSFQTQYIIVVALTILIYDYFLNLANEINWIWRAPKKSSVFTLILYFSNRYLSILAIPVVTLKYFWQDSDPGRLSALVAAVLIQRAYALYGKSKFVLAGTCAIILVAAVLGIVGIVRSPSNVYQTGDLLKTGSCILPTSLLVVGNYMPSIITAMILEVAIFVLTLIKSIEHMKSGSRILEVLLRDGIFYFGLVMLAHFGVILSYYLPEDISRGNVVTLGNCLNSTLISRLILHLRDPSLLQPQASTENIFTTADTLPPGPISIATNTVGFYDEREKYARSASSSLSDSSSHV